MIYVVTLRTMGEIEAKAWRGRRSDLRHDNHTVSLLTDHLVFSPKYRGKVLESVVVEARRRLLRKPDMCVNKGCI
jgi:hypothetical protein